MFPYLLSGQEPYCSKIIKFMTACIAEDSEFYTSTITDAEFLVKPFSDNDFEKTKQYKLLQEKLEVLKCFISEEIAEKAAQLRSVYADIKLAACFQHEYVL